jgi:hypothetical protein
MMCTHTQLFRIKDVYPYDPWPPSFLVLEISYLPFNTKEEVIKQKWYVVLLSRCLTRVPFPTVEHSPLPVSALEYFQRLLWRLRS